MGEIEGEHYAKPYVVEGEGWKIAIDKENRLHGLVDCCRGKFGEELGYAVWNVVRTWQEVRGELSGADLSRLDLSRVPLNGVRCSRLYGGDGGRYLASVFDGARVHATNLFPRGHTDSINSGVCSPTGDRIVSSSEDGTIKEWNAATGECLRTLEGHTHFVNSAVYSPSGDKIVSTSMDGTTKRWDVATEKCLKTHRFKSFLDLSEYHSENMLNTKLPTDGNKIFLPASSRNKEKRTLLNIPGL
jgi:WD40 repeat protein